MRELDDTGVPCIKYRYTRIIPTVSPALCSHGISCFVVCQDSLYCQSCGRDVRLPSNWIYIGKLIDPRELF